MTLRYYANAPATALTVSCTAVATSLQVDSVSGLPIQYPYTLIIDRGESTEEVVEVTAAAGTTLTATRGADSTTAFAHAAGATVVHGFSARDLREPNAHVNENSGHGTTGDVVGTSDAQTLTNKDLSSATNTFPSSLATDTDVTGVQTNLTNHEADTTTHGATGAVVGTTNAQTLTNKTIALGSNTVSGTKAQFNAALTGDDFATLAGSETLTNKTLTSPALTTPSIDGVAISSAWTSFTPVITAGITNPTYTIVGAFYKKVGRICFIDIDITFTSVGSGAYTMTLGDGPAVGTHSSGTGQFVPVTYNFNAGGGTPNIALGWWNIAAGSLATPNPAVTGDWNTAASGDVISELRVCGSYRTAS